MNRDVHSSPTVSLILSVFNGERYLREAIDSILNQTFVDFEFIIVDDGSTDESNAILMSYHDPRIIHMRHSTNQGLVASLNEGLSRASGRFIARLDADDISLPNRFEEQVKVFNENPQLVIVGSHFHRIDETGKHLKVVSTSLSDTDIRWTLLFECPIGNSSVMVRADPLYRHGLQYNKDMLHAEDYDLWSRLLRYGMAKNIDQPLVKIRRHGDQISSVFVSEQKATADCIAKANLQRLGVSISTSDVRILRSWRRNPRLVTNQDVKICMHFLEILRKFEKEEMVDSQIFAVIRCRWVNKTLGVLSLRSFTFQKMQLLGIFLRHHRTLVVKHLIKRVVWKLKKGRKVLAI